MVGRTPVRCEVVCDLRPAVPVRVCRRRRVRRDRGLAGWKCSPLLACFRASVGQLNDERLPTQRRQKARHQSRFRWQAQESLASGTDSGREAPPEHTERPCARRRKSRRLGMYLSDVLLSHEVFAADGRLLDLGTCLPPPRSWTSASRPIGGLGTAATTCACSCKRSLGVEPT